MEEESKNQTNTPPPQRLSVPKKSDLVLSAVSNLHQSKENSEEDQINSVNRASNNMCLRCNAEINAVLVFCGFDNRGEATEGERMSLLRLHGINSTWRICERGAAIISTICHPG